MYLGVHAVIALLFLLVSVMGYKKVYVILDRGFYSKADIDALYKNHQKFIIGVKLCFRYVKSVLKEGRENLKRWSNLQTQFGAFGIYRTIEWDYKQEKIYEALSIDGCSVRVRAAIAQHSGSQTVAERLSNSCDKAVKLQRSKCQIGAVKVSNPARNIRKSRLGVTLALTITFLQENPILFHLCRYV